jgi:hypothetical protein
MRTMTEPWKRGCNGLSQRRRLHCVSESAPLGEDQISVLIYRKPIGRVLDEDFVLLCGDLGSCLMFALVSLLRSLMRCG